MAQLKDPLWAGDPFAGMRAGETRRVGSFEGTQSGAPGAGMLVVRGSANPIGTMQTLMTQGATLKDATNATVGAAAAKLDLTNAGLRPQESAANTGKTVADTALVNEISKYYGQDMLSQIGLRGAQTAAAQTDTRVRVQDELTPLDDTKLVNSLRSIMKQKYPNSGW